MQSLRYFSLCTMALVLVFSSCKKDDDDNQTPPPLDPLSNYTKIGEQELETGDRKLALYMEEAPFVGYNRVAVRLMESNGDQVENASLSFLPMMDMGAMMHTTPTENPRYNDDLKAYVGSATFIMPDATAGSWTFNVVTEAGDTTSFEIDVVQKDEPRLYDFVSAIDSSTSYFVAMREPRRPEIGRNDFELMIYRRENPMSFPAATGLNVEIEPLMPAMDHGSNNNENPEHVTDGLYRGKVNFTMNGHWEVHVTISDTNGSLMDDGGVFDITFQ